MTEFWKLIRLIYFSVAYFLVHHCAVNHNVISKAYNNLPCIYVKQQCVLYICSIYF